MPLAGSSAKLSLNLETGNVRLETGRPKESHRADRLRCERKEKETVDNTASITALYSRIREILDSARVNTTQVVANWLIGREIVEEQQRGRQRAGYGKRLVSELSKRLQSDFGKGFSARSLEYCRGFYLTYGGLLDSQIPDAARQKFSPPLAIPHALRAESSPPLAIPYALRAESSHTLGGELATNESWQPGRLHSNLSWTHYRVLLHVEKSDARSFYEIEAIDNNWTARELERQINSLLYERLALSKDKKGLLRLAKKGQEIMQPVDVFKDPVVIEFLGLPESPRLVESQLETALLDNLQAFLLELGKGFAFVARQQRLTLDGDHFYIDLVFYHTILKCFILIDLKTGKLTHKDLGELQLYVNYYDRECLTEGDNPTLGLILCTDKNDTVVKYTLGPEQSRKVFASRYKLYLPSEEELREEIRREVRRLPSCESPRPASRKAKKP
jgi:predicted nuclease of restriction endonuclease-like (RecB) superfamily